MIISFTFFHYFFTKTITNQEKVVILRQIFKLKAILLLK